MDIDVFVSSKFVIFTILVWDATIGIGIGLACGVLERPVVRGNEY